MQNLARFNLVAVVLAFLFSILVANDPPIDAAEAIRHRETSQIFIFVGMFFWIGFCITFKANDK